MKLHQKSVLSFFRGYRAQAPDQEHLAKEGGPKYQLPGPLVHPPGKPLLPGAPGRPHTSGPHPVGELPSGATESYDFTMLTPRVEDTEGGRAYKLAAENEKELGAWLWALAGVSWRWLSVLLPTREAQYQELCQAAGQEPSSPLEDCGFLATLSSPSSFQELHERFWKEIWALQVVHRGLQEASDNEGSRSQAKVEQELNHCLLMSD